MVEVEVTLQLTVGQSVSMSRCRAHSGTCDQILLSVRRLLSESCRLVPVGQSVVIYQYSHQGFTFHMFYSSAFSPGSVQQIMLY
jgi:hypothetical protein